MPPFWSLPGRDDDERRFDGPVLPHDPAMTPASDHSRRECLFRRLADDQRRHIVGLRARLNAPSALRDERLQVWQRSLRFYRDQGTAWWGERRD